MGDDSRRTPPNRLVGREIGGVRPFEADIEVKMDGQSFMRRVAGELENIEGGFARDHYTTKDKTTASATAILVEDPRVSKVVCRAIGKESPQARPAFDVAESSEFDVRISVPVIERLEESFRLKDVAEFRNRTRRIRAFHEIEGE